MTSSESFANSPSPHAIRVSASVITHIQKGLKTKGMTQSALADKIGWHRSNMSKLLKGKIETIAAETVDKINDALGIVLNPIQYPEGSVSQTALALSALAEKNAVVAEVMERLLDLANPAIEPFLPQVDTKKLPKIGAAITRIVHAWEQGEDPHYSKIAVETLHFLRVFYAKEK